MKKKLKLACLLGLFGIMLVGCGGVNVQQNTSTLEVGTRSLQWKNYITVEESENYNITYDASQVNINELGEYTVTYTFENKKNQKVVTKDFTFVVQDTTPPTLLLWRNPVDISLGQEFDPLKYVNVVDNYDTLAKEDIQVEGIVDTSQEGSYVVTYRVADSSGNESEIVLNVNVTKKMTYGELSELWVDSIYTIIKQNM